MAAMLRAVGCGSVCLTRLLPALRPGIAAHFTSSAIVQQAKKKAGAPAAAAAAVAEEKYDLTKQIPVNLAKDGAEPEYKPDSEYPDWLWKVLEEKPLLEDYVMKGLENVPEGEMKMVQRMISKRGIKAGNAERRKD